jgi:hypothetical protein
LTGVTDTALKNAMSEPDRTRQREHWQAIAEQLGLAPESEESFPSEPSPSPSPAQVRGEEDRTAEPPTPLAEPAKHAEAKSPQRGRRRRSAPADEATGQRARPDRPSTDERAEKEASAEPARAGEERPAPRRGRRRGAARPSTETKREATDSTFSAEASSQEEETGKAAERPKRRGRGRVPPQKAQAAEATQKPSKDDEIASPVAAPEEPEDAELDDVRSLSNWNVPSWNELISSLYRPER